MLQSLLHSSIELTTRCGEGCGVGGPLPPWYAARLIFQTSSDEGGSLVVGRDDTVRHNFTKVIQARSTIALMVCSILIKSLGAIIPYFSVDRREICVCACAAGTPPRSRWGRPCGHMGLDHHSHIQIALSLSFHPGTI